MGYYWQEEESEDKMCGMYNTHKRKEVKKQYASLDMEVKKWIQRDYRRYMDSIACEAQSGADYAT
jgi:hypothetical protein